MKLENKESVFDFLFVFFFQNFGTLVHNEFKFFSVKEYVWDGKGLGLEYAWW